MSTEWVSNQTAQCLYNVAWYELCFCVATQHLSVWALFIFSFMLKTCFDLLPLSCKTNLVKALGAWLCCASPTICAVGSAWSHPWAGFAWTGSANPRAGSLRVFSSLHPQKCRSVTPSAAQSTGPAAPCCTRGMFELRSARAGAPHALLHPAEHCPHLLAAGTDGEAFTQFYWVRFFFFFFSIVWEEEPSLLMADNCLQKVKIIT